ncbi:MAG: T9SS type A sorting domain-containing protein [Flavobacteriales bacterium]|nr:T9SS type A sorting domain-containing protein [Flavobacteriales bacterium]MBL6873513.1 T9SS type A sorting domain-containing protein [Flavobacteriales bacterium]
MKSILQKNTNLNLALALIFSFFTLSLTAQDFSPEVSFNLDNSVMGEATTFSFEISQSEGETDIANSTITTDGGSFDIASLTVGDIVGSGSGFIGGGSSSGEFSLVVNALTENSADLNVVDFNSEVIGMMNISNSSNNGVSIYSSNTYEDGNNVTAGNNQQVELAGIFINPMSSFVTLSSSIFSELDPNGPSADYSTQWDLMADFSPEVLVTLSSSEPSTFTDLTFSVSQDAGEEDMASVTYAFDGGSFAISSMTVGDVVGNGSGSFGGGFASGDYSIVVDQVTATTAVLNAVDGENVIATFSIVNYEDGGAEISSTSPGDDNTTTAGNSNDFTLEGIFVTPDSDMLTMTADFVSEINLSQTNTFEVTLEEVVDFSPELEVVFANNDCNAATDMTFTISQDNGEIDMASSILTMTGGSFDFSSSEVGDLVGTGSGFYGGDNTFNLSLYVDEVTATGAVILAVNDDDETQTSSFTITNLAEGVQISTTSPGDDNTTTLGNSTAVTLSGVFVNPNEGDYEFYGSFTSELNNSSEFDGAYSVVCPCEDVEVSEAFTLCAGETLTIGENTYDEAGEYVNVYALASGCDSTVTTTLSFFDVVATPTISGETNATENESYDYNVDVEDESTLQWGVVNGEVNSGQGTATANITWGDGPSTGSVWFLLTDENGCKADTAFLDVTISETVGITENTLLGVNVYPNPFKEFTTVEFNNPNNDTYRISLMDARGRTVMNTSTQSSQLIIKKENLKEGIYFLEFDGKNKSRQIVVIQ